jgi:hypothetical protein
MAYFYIKTGGTATGTVSYPSRKTGSWSTAFTDTSQYYNDLVTWATLATSSAGDIVYVSDLHNSSKILSSSLSIGSIDTQIYCVDDDDLNILSTGGKETYSPSTYSITLGEFTYIYGMNFVHEGVVRFTTSDDYYGLSTIFEKCTFEFSNNSVGVKQHELFADETNCVFFKECIFNFTSNGYIKLEGGKYIFIGCEFISTYNTYPIFSNLNDLSGTVGGIVKLIACDFTQANRPIFDSGGNLYQPLDFIRQFIVDRCSFATNSKLKLPTNASNSFPNKFLESHPIDYNTDTSYLAYYKYGIVSTNTSIYRQGGANYKFEYDRDTRLFEKLYPFSFKVETYNSCNYNHFKGIRFKLIDFISDFSFSRVITIFFACTSDYALLTNKDFYVDIVYPDDTTSKAHVISNMLLPLATETTYPIGGGDWTGTVSNGFLRQKYSVSTTELGKKDLCSVWIHIFVPNKIIYFCPKVSIS